MGEGVAWDSGQTDKSGTKIYVHYNRGVPDEGNI